MNSRRRADLQRKLSMGAVPRPPDDLLARIKADIPKHLEPHAPPQRGTSLPLFMRVAASLILLVTTGLVTWRVLQRNDGPIPMVRDARYFPPVQSAAQNQRTQAAEPAEATEEVHLEITESVPEPEALLRERTRPIVRTTTAENRNEEAPRNAAANRREERAMDRAAETTAGVAAVTHASSDEAPSRFISESSALPPPPPMPAAPPAEVEADTIRAEAIAVTGAHAASNPHSSILDSQSRNTPASPVAESKIGSRFAPAGPIAQQASQDTRSLFGISVDQNAFNAARQAVERGEALGRDAIDVEAIVNYFAGDAPKPPRSGARLELELSPAPLAVPGDRAYLRISIDTPRVSRTADGLVARDVTVSLDLNDDVVSSWRQVGGDGSIDGERQLSHDVAVTALYQLDLRAPLDASARIATVELRYTRPGDGRQERFSRTLHARDLVSQWAKSTRRHRLATLGALWGEGLAGSAQAAELARKAQELAEQSPRDRRARELAEVATATARGSTD